MPLKSSPRFFVFFLIVFASSARAQAPSKRAMTFDDLMAVQRVGEAQISPDGRAVLYTVGTTDMDTNRVAHNIWVVPTAPGSQPRQLTQTGHDTRPQWSPDGKTIAFLSSREGVTQVYAMPAQGGNAKKITSLSTGADNEKWSPDGRWIAFTSSVFPDCADDACNRARDDAAEKSKVKARAYDHLLYRHWVHWSDGKRSHLFLVAASGGAPRDVTARADYDVPPDERGDANDFNFSPDSKELCFTAVTDRPEAISTNGDLFLVPTSGGEPKAHHLQSGLRRPSCLLARRPLHRLSLPKDSRVRERPLAPHALRPRRWNAHRSR